MESPPRGYNGAAVYFIAIKMLIGDRAKYLGIVIGLTFASLLITQQLAIFFGLMTRTFGALRRHRPDLLHIHHVWPAADRYLPAIARAAGVPHVVVTEHIVGRSHSVAQRALKRRELDQADAVDDATAQRARVDGPGQRRRAEALGRKRDPPRLGGRQALALLRKLLLGLHELLPRALEVALEVI